MRHIRRTQSKPPQSQFENFSRDTVPLNAALNVMTVAKMNVEQVKTLGRTLFCNEMIVKTSGRWTIGHEKKQQDTRFDSNVFPKFLLLRKHYFLTQNLCVRITLCLADHVEAILPINPKMFSLIPYKKLNLLHLLPQLYQWY